MATYYVRPDGSDANAGTGPATNQAWQTITKAIGATGIAPGDTLYIAPGVYRGNFTAGFTNPSSNAQRVTISGNPTASLFSGVTAGPVVITNFSGPTTTTSGLTLSVVKDYVTLTDVYIVGYQPGGGTTFGKVFEIAGIYSIVQRCGFYSPSQSTESYTYSFTCTAGSRGVTVEDSVFFGHTSYTPSVAGSSYDSQSLFRNNIFINQNTSSNTLAALRIDSGSTSATFGGVKVINCRFTANTGIRPYQNFRISQTFPVTIQNCIFDTANGIISTITGDFIESYNIFNCTTERTNVATGTGSLTRAFISPDFTLSRLSGWANLSFWANHNISASQNAGINTNSDTVDFYGVTWLTPSTPTMGPIEYFSNSTAGAYLPTERNASAITIAPASTSQSIELYLGATGLTFSTTGLAAYYVRNQAAPVAITLVTQTATGAWTSGGFAEISSSLVPGVYRLDVPNAAFAAGASDVTIVVRGASGTNGAVLTVTLSSSGLTAAQTAAAVWDEPYTSHTTASTFGARTLKTTVDNRPVDVGTSNHIQANVHAIVDSTAAASELSGALLHNGTDYISAELVTPVSTASLIYMGPFQVIADGVTTPQPLDIQKGTQQGIGIQLVDNNLAGISITGATITAKVYNSGGTLVATYSGTATYAADGRAQFTITTTVTNTPGTYTATITRTTGASDTQVFGPLRIYVRDI